MKWLGIHIAILTLGCLVFADGFISQTEAQQPSDIEQLNAVSQEFAAAIAGRDITAMEKVWAHNPDVTFIGPLSTTVVKGWEEVRKAWIMRFGQFDRVTVSLGQSHIRTHGDVAWLVGMEKVELLRKNGTTLRFDAFVTNVFEKSAGSWLMVSHHATPLFREVE